MEPVEFTRRVEECSVLVAHAGMGSILTALQYGKPILVMPRHAAKGETRNDHQIATAQQLGERPGIEVAVDEREIADKLDRLSNLSAPPKISNTASPELVARLKSFQSTERIDRRRSAEVTQDTCGPKLSGTGASIRRPSTEIHQAWSMTRSPSGPP